MIKQAVFGVLGSFAALTAVPAAMSVPAFAVDNIESTDAPDLTSARAKIAAKDYAGALAELRNSILVTSERDFQKLGRRIQVLWLARP